MAENEKRDVPPASAPSRGESGESAAAEICVLDLEPKEIKALIEFAIDSGIDREVIDQTLAAFQSYQQKKNGATERELARTYAALVTQTAPVTGRTLLDSSSVRWGLLSLVWMALSLLAIAVANEVLRTWLADQPTADAGWHLWLYNLQNHFLDQVAPLLWGGIGASIYLMKHIYDILAERRFDRRKFKGWWLRIVIGAVLAIVTLQIFSPESLSEHEDLPLTAAAVAFLVGLGVKVVYGALERVVEELAQRMSLERAGKEREPGSAAIREFLRRKIVEAQRDEADERTRILAELQEELRTSTRSRAAAESG